MKIENLHKKPYDLKNLKHEDSENRPPMFLKYILVASMILTVSALAYSSSKVVWHLTQKTAHEHRLADNEKKRKEIKDIEESSKNVDRLTTAYEAKQNWANKSYSATALFLEIFQAVPEGTSITGVKVAQVNDQRRHWKVAIKLRDKEIESFIQEFQKRLINYRFEPSARTKKRAQLTIEGTLIHE